MRKENYTERKKETERDETSCFVVERYISNGHHLHFHGDLEIYGVVKGKVSVTIAGECKSLTDGQIVIIDRLENHSYEMDGEAEVFSIHVGTRYLRYFFSVYPDKKLPRWLLDVEFNRTLYEYIEKILGVPQESIPELERIGIICQMLSDAIEHYGLVDKIENSEGDTDLVTEIVQYIYAHYNENITLEILAKKFHLSPTTLSKKIGKRLGVDLRMFVNDVRVQKAVQMLDDPENKNKTINEIAIMCGFNSMGTFYRSYKRNFSFHKLNRENDFNF